MNPRFGFFVCVVSLVFLTGTPGPAKGQENSVRPGINRYYEKPDWDRWVRAFERPGREVYDRRHAIVAATGIHEGMDVADIGAGTGLFTRLFSSEVGSDGSVYAVDISDTFISNILHICAEEGITNVRGIVNTPYDAALPENSIDLAFISDTYHHFEYPEAMLASINRALRDGGRLIIVDFRRRQGTSSRWVMGHVRADSDTVVKEVESAGFDYLGEMPLLRINYFMIFEKRPHQRKRIDNR
jgi:predicted methyltransferase